MKRTSWSLLVLTNLVFISGGIWCLYKDKKHYRENEYFNLVGSVDADIEGVEAKILPLNKTISWGDIKGGFLINLSKMEAHNMKIIKFKFHSRLKGLIEHDVKADMNIGTMHVTCRGGVVSEQINTVTFW